MTAPWRRNNLAATLAVFLLSLGFSFSVPFLPLFLQRVDPLTEEKAAFWAGVATGLGGLGVLLTGPLWGTLGDRYGRKPMLVRAAFGGAIGLLAIGLSEATWQVVAARVWVGIMAGAGPAALALIAGGTPEEHMARAMGAFQAFSLMGVALGPVAAFPLIDAVGYRTTFFITSGVMLAGAMMTVLLIREDRTPLRKARAERAVAVGPRPRSALRTILRQPAARRSFAIVSLLGIGAPMAQSSVLASFAKKITDPDYVTLAIGLLFSGIAVFGAPAALLAGRLLDRRGTTTMLSASCLGAGLLLLPQGLAQSIWQLAPFVLGVAFFQGGVQTATVRLVSNVVSREEAGVGFGIYQSVQMGASQIGPFVGGALAAAIGLRGVFPIAGCALLVGGVLAATLLPPHVNAAPELSTTDRVEAA